MLKWLAIIARTLRSALRSQRELALENLVLRQQLAVLKYRHPRPRLSDADRLFWLLLSRIWSRWRESLHVVKPETVVRWHRQGFRYYWRWRSRRHGRPQIDPAVRDLIRRMCRANSLWGAPRIHGELLKLGIEVSEATVSKYMIRRRGPQSQTWRAFLDNHAKDIVAMDFFTVPTAAFRILYVLVLLHHARRHVIHFNVTEHPTSKWIGQQLCEAFPCDTAPRYLLRDRDGKYGDQYRCRARSLAIDEVVIAPRSPWQSPFVERVIGSIRRDCLNHVIVLNQRHLGRILRAYLDYYHGSRTHLSLHKDPPDTRRIEAIGTGKIIALPKVGGLHHRYTRLAA